MDHNAIQSLAVTATAVAAVATEHDEATRAERAAKLALLARIFASARPGLRSVSIRPVISARYRAPSVGPSRETRAEWSGILISGEKDPIRAKDGSGDFRGAFQGKAWYLDASGERLYRVSYSGAWSSWEAESDELTSEITVYHLPALPDRIVDSLDPATIATRLAEAFAERLADLPASTQAARDRAARFSALAALL